MGRRDPDLSRAIDRHAVRALWSAAGRRVIVDAMLRTAAVSRFSVPRDVGATIEMAGRPVLPVKTGAATKK